jgi:hypothetical protein
LAAGSDRVLGWIAPLMFHFMTSPAAASGRVAREALRILEKDSIVGILPSRETNRGFTHSKEE